MKRLMCIVLLFSLVLCGCSEQQYEVGTFSYTEHCVGYADQNISFLDTQGQKKQTIRNGDDAVAVARKYCLINNAEIMVDFDPLTGVYCVVFIPAFEIDGNTVMYTDSQTVHVYVNKEGIALMTIVIRQEK